MMESFETDGVAGTVALGERLSSRFGPGDLVALVGELGAGKTVFVRGVARGLGVPDERIVCSPSYVLVHEYAGRFPIFHVDLYRLGEPAAELGQLGLDEMLAAGVVLIEWAERAGGALPRPHWRITIESTAPESRTFTLQRVG